MTRVQHSLDIAAPVEEVFSYIVEGLNTPEWHPSMLTTRRTTAGALRVGSRLKVEASVAGRTYAWEQEVVELVPNRSFKDVVRSNSFKKFEDWASFESTGSGTRWTFGIDYELPWGCWEGTT